MTDIIGWSAIIPCPDVDGRLADGYTVIRIYTSASEGGTYALADTLSLVSGTYAYTTNQTAGLQSDWWQYCFYGVTPGEGPRTDPAPVGSQTYTRLQVRQAVGQRMGWCDVYTVSSATDPSIVINDLIDPDASPHLMANRTCRVTTGTYANTIRRVRAGITGYAPSTGTITVNRNIGGNLQGTDQVELWKLKGADRDLSAIVDQSMQSARGSLSYETTTLIVTTDDTSEYALPQGIDDTTIKRVEYAARMTASDYPDKPDWRPVGYAKANDGVLTVYYDAAGVNFRANTVLRLTYLATPDRMDSDTDSWTVPDLDWAAAETALRAVARLKVLAPNPQEKQQYDQDAKDLLAECMPFRKLYWPQAGGIVVPAR